MSAHDAELLAGIGVKRVTTLTMPAPEALAPRDPPAAPTLLSLGSMSWFGVEDGLVWFYEKVLPIVRQSVPDVRWQLVGPGAPRRMHELAAADPAVVVQGYVEELGPVVAESRVALIPLRFAGGIRMKLLDLFAWGVPTVSTSVGAQGLDFADGQGCLRRDDPAAFAAAVVELLQNDGLWRATADGGRSYLAARTGGHQPRRRIDGRPGDGPPAAPTGCLGGWAVFRAAGVPDRTEEEKRVAHEVATP